MDSGKSSPSNLSRSNSLRLSNSMTNCNRTSLVRRNQSLNAKQIKFFRNGDRYFTGLKLAVSTERYKGFESLLTELSSKLNLATGAVRFIFNSNNGSIINDISELQNGVAYVCSSSNFFRQIEGGYGRLVQNYSGILKKQKQQIRNLQPIDSNSSVKYEYTSSKEFIKPKLVTVIRNGKLPQKKVTLLLNNKTAVSLDQVLDQLSAKGSLGKVDKLHTTDGKLIRCLRDLFEDNTVFIALSTNEKFPDDGIELDPNSYRITPYREMKKPGAMVVRRSNSLRHGMRYKDENENMPVSRAGKPRKGTTMKVNPPKVARPRRSALKKSEQNNKEELYPTAVFESDSESAKSKSKRNQCKKNKPTKPKHNPNNKNKCLDIYNTVWLSHSVRSCATRSICSTLNQSGFSTASQCSNLNQSDFTMNDITRGHSTPRNVTANNINIHGSANIIADKFLQNGRINSPRTLSLPDLTILNGSQLQDRFIRLQLEKENRDLCALVADLHGYLEQVNNFMRVNHNRSCPQCVDNACKVDIILNGHYEGDRELVDRELMDVTTKNESGYDTMMQDMDMGKNDDKPIRIMNKKHSSSRAEKIDDGNYSDSDIGSMDSLMKEEPYFQSRLLNKTEKDNTNQNCCRLQ